MFKYQAGPHEGEWDLDRDKLNEDVRSKLDYYRPVQAGIATLQQTMAMTAQELTEINQIADTLLNETAIRIANSIGRLFDDGKKK